MSHTCRKMTKSVQPAIACIILLVLTVSGALAAETATLGLIETRRIDLVSGKSIVLRTEAPAKRISIAKPEVADFNLLSPTEIYLTGKEAGTTNLTIWQDGKVSAVYDLVVSYDVSRLKQQLQEMMPGERELRVAAANDSLTLSGKVTNAAMLNRALSLTKAYAPEGKVANLVEVGGVHQVMLEVRVAEMTRTLTRRLGINFSAVKGDQAFFVSSLANLSSIVKPDDAILGNRGVFGQTFSSTVNALFRFNTNNMTWTGFVDALQEDGLIKVLAEPTLVTLSGQKASFLAGGQFPVPVPQGLGTVAIEYKNFGVLLEFTPLVLGEDKISMKVVPEVSDLDFSIALTLQGFVIPGLRVRQASTTVELGDGQSFAIAGLLRDNVRTVASKYPLLGDIPILGMLFQSKAFQKEETELVIIVTPHLVKPLEMARQTLPTDYYADPNNFEFYVLGQTEGRGSPKSRKGQMDGDFGHSMPK